MNELTNSEVRQPHLSSAFLSNVLHPVSHLLPPSSSSSWLPSGISTDSGSPFISICVISLLRRQITSTICLQVALSFIKHLTFDTKAEAKCHSSVAFLIWSLNLASINPSFYVLLQNRGPRSKAKCTFSTLRQVSARGTTPEYRGTSTTASVTSAISSCLLSLCIVLLLF